MARTSRDPRERKRELLLILDSSRSGLRTRGHELRRRLNPVRAAGAYLRRHPLRVFGGTALGVALLTYLFRPGRGRKNPPKSTLGRILRGVITLFKPALRIWVLKQAKEIIQAKPPGPQTDSLLGP